MRDKLVIKNTGISTICQILDVILGFIVRKMFIKYIGMEMLGVNGTFASILNTLSLAELGFESAVIYRLYQPMKEKNTQQIEEIVVILKKIYEFVGIFILMVGILISAFLPWILKGVKINAEIYIVFYLQLIGIAITYFLAYKRTFILALQKDYIRNVFVSVYKIIATTIQIVLILRFHSFVLYVTVSILQNFFTNYSIAKYVDKTTNYNFKRKKINKEILKKLYLDVKEIFIGKLAGYIYTSTDNLIISACINTLSVGLLGNYTQILYQMKTVITNVFNSTKPIIGHFLTSDTTKEHSKDILDDYTFIRYTVAVCMLVPGYVLCDCFISSWLGPDYILSKQVSLFLVTDIFIHLVHGALVDYISGLGYFKQDRKCSIVGAGINIVLSLALVHIIGMAGVLIGTVVSQSYFWISRSIIIFREYFEDIKGMFIDYWRKCSVYILSFYVLCFGCQTLFERIPLANSYFKFIIGGIMCVVIVLITLLLLFRKTREFKYAWNMVCKYF